MGYMDLHTLVADVRAHVAVGRSVVLHDNPLTRDLGYMDEVNGAVWVINLTDAKRSLAERPDAALAACLGTLDGRLAMVA